jgi:hypothetical protein
VNLTLRNLAFVPLTNPHNGVLVNQTANVTIDHCTFTGLPEAAVEVLGVNVSLRVMDSVIQGGGYGLLVEGASHAQVSGTKFLGLSQAAVYAKGFAGNATLVDVSDSIIQGVSMFSGYGVRADTDDASPARVSLNRSTVSNTGIAAYATSTNGGPTLVSVSQSTLAHNGTGMQQDGDGSVVTSLGNNTMADNIFNNVGTLTTATTM